MTGHGYRILYLKDMNTFSIYTMMLLTLLLSAMTLTSCEQAGTSAAIETAEKALANGDYEMARDICDELTGDDATLNKMYSTELGRLSIICLKIAGRDDDGRYAEIATRCYRASFTVNADSAVCFYSSLPAQDYALSETLRQLEPARDAGPAEADMPDESYGGNDSAGDVEFSQP